MEPTPLTCPRCGSTHRQTKHGKSAAGKQRYQCQDCTHRYVKDPQPRGLDPALHQEALRLYLEQNGFRRIARRLRVNHQTVINWIRAREQVQPPAPLPTATEVVEMDELYALQAKKGSSSS